MKKNLIILLFCVSPFILTAQWYETTIPQESVVLCTFQFINKDSGYVNYLTWTTTGIGNYTITNDCGKSWNILQSADTLPRASIMAFTSKDNGLFIAYLSRDVFRTTDGFTSVRKMATFSSVMSSIIFNKNSKSDFFVNSDSCYKTKDFGDTWSVVYPKRLESLQFVNKNTGFALSSFSGANTEFYKTIDGGDTWLQTFIFPGRFFYRLNMISADTGFCIFQKTSGSSIDSLYKTNDGGKTWQPLTNPIPGAKLYDIYFADSKMGYLITLAGKSSVYKTIDGGLTWHLQQEDFNCTMEGFQAIDKDVIFLKPKYPTKCIYYTINGGGPVGSTQEQIEPEKKWKIQPNPAQSYFIIKTEGKIASVSKLYLMNIQGQILQKQDIMEQDNVIDISSLSRGVYFVKVVDEKGVWVGKVVKELTP